VTDGSFSVAAALRTDGLISVLTNNGETFHLSAAWARKLASELNEQADRSDAVPSMHCSFCGKDKNEVKKIVVGPNNVTICDECSTLVSDIVGGKRSADDKEAF